VPGVCTGRFSPYWSGDSRIGFVNELANPTTKRLMLGYLLGALMTSITLGLVIVFSFEGSDAVSTTENTLSPAATMALGRIALVAAFVSRPGRHQAATERRQARKQDKGPPRWQQVLGKGSARSMVVVGVRPE
jgi:hypothetical protein